ncbi:MAG: hypothetical protein J7L69_01140 [Desulfobulbaceae bacterium]|nr:hypothetical protein [Desulfobulbaceae bacterium]
MKKLCPLLIMLGILMTINSTAREPQPLDHWRLNEKQFLNNYRTRNLDEQQIVKLALDYQQACNLYDPAGVFATYAPGALIKAGINDTGSAQMVQKEKYFPLLVEKLSKWKLYHFTLQLLAPEAIHVKKEEATLHVPYLIVSITQEYWEKGIFIFGCRKTGNRWLISNSTGTIKDLHYNP